MKVKIFSIVLLAVLVLGVVVRFGILWSGRTGIASPRNLVLLDQPTPNQANPEFVPPAPLFGPADPYVPGDVGGFSSKLGFDGVKSNIVKPLNAIVEKFEDVPAWRAELDSPRFKFTPSADITIPLPSNGRFPTPPLFSDLGGPYIAVPVQWDQMPFGSKPGNDGREPEVVENPQSPISVIDARTGKSTGNFDWRVPIGMSPVLSPDGRNLVGPYHVPVNVGFGSGSTTAKELLSHLYVWEINASEFKTKLPIPEFIHWYGFVGKTELAVLVSSGRVDKLQFWNIESGKNLGILDLPYDGYGINDDWRVSETEARVGSSQRGFRDPIVAVSPRGKYLVVVGKQKLVLVSCKERKLLGTVEIDNISKGLESARFSDDASKIVVFHDLPISSPSSREFRIIEYDAQTGCRLSQRDCEGSPNGELIWASQSAVVMPAQLMPRNEKRLRNLTEFELLKMTDSGPAFVITTNENKAEAKLIGREIVEAKCEGLVGAIAVKEPPTVEMGPESKEFAKRKPPNESVPIAETVPATPFSCKTLPTRPSYIRMGGNTVGALIESPGDTPNDRRLEWLQLDAKTGVPLAAPILISQWKVRNEVPPDYAFAVTKDDQRFALGDPRSPDRLLVYNSDGTGVVRCKPFGEGAAIEWMDFLEDGRLMLAAMRPVRAQVDNLRDGDRPGADLMLLDISDQSAKVNYHLIGGGYQAPYGMLRDRRRVVISRAGSIDLIDGRTGECLSEFGAGKGERIGNLFALSPDGNQFSVVHVDQEGYLKKIIVWNLTTREATQQSIEHQDKAFLTWASNEHLLFCGERSSILFDLRLKSRPLEYSSKKVHNDTPLAVLDTFDGDLWIFDGNSDREYYKNELNKRQGLPYSWKATGPRAAKSEAEVPYFAEDRTTVYVKATPLALELDLRTSARAKKHGPVLIKSLESQGYRIGPNGFVACVEAKVAGSGKILTSQSPNGQMAESLPKIEYRWKLQDAQGRVAWTGKTEGFFQYSKSKYYRGTAPDNRGSNYERYDFGSQKVQDAVAAELMDEGIGLTLPADFPNEVILGNGKYGIVPGSAVWTTVDVDASQTQ